MSGHTWHRHAGCPADSRVREPAEPRAARHLFGAFLTVVLLAGCNLEDPGVLANAPEDGLTGAQAAKLFLANCYEKTDTLAVQGNPDFKPHKSRNTRYFFAAHKSRMSYFNGLKGRYCTMYFIGNKGKIESEREAAAALQNYLGVELSRSIHGRPSSFTTSKGKVGFFPGGSSVKSGTASAPDPYEFVLSYTVTE